MSKAFDCSLSLNVYILMQVCRTWLSGTPDPEEPLHVTHGLLERPSPKTKNQDSPGPSSELLYELLHSSLWHGGGGGQDRSVLDEASLQTYTMMMHTHAHRGERPSFRVLTFC